MIVIPCWTATKYSRADLMVALSSRYPVILRGKDMKEIEGDRAPTAAIRGWRRHDQRRRSCQNLSLYFCARFYARFDKDEAA